MLKQIQDLLTVLTELFAGVDIDLAAFVDDAFEFLEDFRFMFTRSWSARVAVKQPT